MATQSYISINDLLESFNERADFHYKTTLSFSPLLQALEDEKHASPRNQAFLKKLIQHLEKHGVEKSNEQLQDLFKTIFPLVFQPKLMGFVAAPFSKVFFFTTPEVRTHLFEQNLEARIDLEEVERIRHLKTIEAASLILNRCYEQEIDFNTFDILHFRDKKTHLEEHYRLDINHQFVQVKLLKPLKELSQRQVHELLNNTDNLDLWLDYLPPENFELYGLSCGQMTDITEQAIISALKDETARNTDAYPKDLIPKLRYFLRAFLKMPDLEMGMTQIMTLGRMDLPMEFTILRGYVNSSKEVVLKGSFHEKVLNTKKAVIVAELSETKSPTLTEKRLLEKGYQSLLLLPLMVSDHQMIGILEIAAPTPFRFTAFHIAKLKAMCEMFAAGLHRSLQHIDNLSNLIIQEQFTALHPSVQWRFKEVAGRMLMQRVIDEKVEQIEPIVFPNLHPLYGQADIVGSSDLRNKFIQADLLTNVKLLEKLLSACSQSVPYHLLKVYWRKTESYIEHLSKTFISSDEMELLEFITQDVHPVLEEIAQKYPQLVGENVAAYFKNIDPKVGIVYDKRRAYDNSVTQLNKAMISHLKAEDDKMQSVFPHYFEHFQTDGVEYNLYLGKSIAPEENYTEHQLKNFRLWQLLHMVEITRLVKRKSQEMPVPLTTAQLIFVYGAQMGIRFRLDEKKFDVDGAYNVRYEILKKRIDKSVIKGTNERLTQSGKIAIVYLQEKDKVEYLEYLDYLVQEGLILEDIEQLELEKLQGAEGLRALRVTVVHEAAN